MVSDVMVSPSASSGQALANHEHFLETA